ncbi:MAG: hypothetical protein U0R50_03400 [Gaiellales bacterium]
MNKSEAGTPIRRGRSRSSLHAAVASLILGIATIAGVVALSRTLALGPSRTDATKAIAVRQSQLARASAQLRALRKSGPPSLPPVTRKREPAEQVIYVRGPSPRVTTAYRDDDYGESEHEGGELDD